MERKYTPGPWRIVPNKESGGECFDIRTGGDYGPCIAQWVDPANARLIAAAPEIAICLEAMLKITCGNCEGGDDRCGDACMVAQQAKAALAKARGE